MTENMSQQGGNLKSLPRVCLIISDTVGIGRDCLARRRWRNKLRISSGSNQTAFRGQTHNPQFTKVDRVLFESSVKESD